MKKNVKRKSYLKNVHLSTGKISKHLTRNDSTNEELTSNQDYRQHVIKTLPCPYQFDNPEIYKEFTKPFQKAKFSCEVDVETTLSASALEDHQHEIVLDIGTAPIESITDLSEYEFDFADLQCGIFFSTSHQSNAILLKKELIKDKAVEEYRKQIEENAKGISNGKIGNFEIDQNSQRLKYQEQLFLQMNSYIETHLTEEINRVVNRLVKEFFTLNDRGEIREIDLNKILNEEGKALRKRVSAIKGRTPKSKLKTFQSEQETFIKNCLKILKELDKGKENLDRTRLSETLFPDNSNPLQTLRRKLKVLGLSFEGILQMYNEHKSS